MRMNFAAGFYLRFMERNSFLIFIIIFPSISIYLQNSDVAIENEKYSSINFLLFEAKSKLFLDLSKS